MNFYTHWESVCIQKCIALFIWRVKYFLCYCSLRNGACVIVIHTISNGIALFSPVFEVLEHMEEKNYPMIPNDARLMYAMLGSALIVLGTVLFLGLVRLKLYLLINFAIGMEIIMFMFPIMFPFAYVRVYVETLQYFREETPLSPEDAYGLKNRENHVFGFLYVTLIYCVVCYFLYFYYVVVVLSYYDEVAKANDSKKSADTDLTPEEMRSKATD